MTLPRALFTLALCAFVAAAPSSPAAPADDEQKAARKALKKNLKKLAKVQKFLAEQDRAARESGNAQVRDRAEETIDEVCTEQLGELLEQIRLADDGDAAAALVGFGVFVPNDNAYERVVRELARMESDEAVEALGELLAGDLDEGEPGKKKRKKRKKTQAGEPWKTQVLVADVFHDLEHPGTVAPVALQLRKGTQPAVVNACVRAAEYKAAPAIVAALIELLGRVEQQGGWEYHNVRQRLTGLTGHDFFTQEKWQAWWAANGGDAWDPEKKGEVTEAATKERGPKEEVPTFFGSEIESNRLVFVIDTSGSMQMTDRPEEYAGDDAKFLLENPDDPAVKARQRIERAKSQAVAAIRNLVSTQQFNVIAFSSGNRKWRPTTVPATEANKRDAITFCEALAEGGGTNTAEALQAAFGDETIDTIYLLSDGAPMTKVGNPGEQQKEFAEEEIRKILYQIKQLNRFRRVKINTFGMDGPGVWHKKWGPRPVTLPEEPEFLAPLQQFMRDLAAVTGGEYKSI